MRHHAIAADVPCPHCGQPGLEFIEMTRQGDKYRCKGCSKNVLHISIGQRSQRRGCGLRALLGAVEWGTLRPCGKAGE